MLRESLITCCLAILCLLAGRTVFGAYDDEFKGIDVFQALRVDAEKLRFRKLIDDDREEIMFKRDESGYGVREIPSQIDRLNNLLVRRTYSGDPETNFDILHEELIEYYKLGGNFDSEEAQAKRLVLALQTLKGEHLCNYYGLKIIENNRRAIGIDTDSIVKKRQLKRRVDSILAHFIRERVMKCVPIYLRNFDRIDSNLDKTQMKRLDRVVGNFIDNAIDTNSKIANQCNAEKFYNLATWKTYHAAKIDPADIYEAMIDLVKDDEDMQSTQTDESDKSGFLFTQKDNQIIQIFDKYVTKPCRYFREQFQRDVFELVELDALFGHEVRKDRPDFYKAWYKYFLCNEKFNYERLERLLKYVSSEHS